MAAASSFFVFQSVQTFPINAADVSNKTSVLSLKARPIKDSSVNEMNKKNQNLKNYFKFIKLMNYKTIFQFKLKKRTEKES